LIISAVFLRFRLANSGSPGLMAQRLSLGHYRKWKPFKQ
jgi:hypothetical protein